MRILKIVLFFHFELHNSSLLFKKIKCNLEYYKFLDLTISFDFKNYHQVVFYVYNLMFFKIEAKKMLFQATFYFQKLLNKLQSCKQK